VDDPYERSMHNPLPQDEDSSALSFAAFRSESLISQVAAGKGVARWAAASAIGRFVAKVFLG
jgi:hypothetical protein